MTASGWLARNASHRVSARKSTTITRSGRYGGFGIRLALRVRQGRDHGVLSATRYAKATVDRRGPETRAPPKTSSAYCSSGPPRTTKAWSKPRTTMVTSYFVLGVYRVGTMKLA